jgi:hypothetical protein
MKRQKKPKILLHELASDQIKPNSYSKQPLHTLNLKYLRKIAKDNKIKMSGKKGELIERLKTVLERQHAATLLQKIYRGHSVRRICSHSQRVYITKITKSCVNESDFYSMEPIDEIPAILFYAFQHVGAGSGVVYAFNIESLVHLIRQTPEKTPVKNPYNRIEFSNRELQMMVYRYAMILQWFPQCVDADLMQMCSGIRRLSIDSNVGILAEITMKLERIRAGTIEQRIIGLFMEMDSLGNYTDSAWFSNLNSRHEFRRLFRVLYNIWFHPSRLSLQLRNAIFVIGGDPFERIIGFTETLDISRIREKCLRVLENLVYGGQDVDHRKLGAFYALTALTVVSIDARHAMPWLYESLF